MNALGGEGHLESVQWRDHATDTTETRAIRHVFSMAGARPNTAWLAGCVALDSAGFIKTGPDLSPEELALRGPQPRRRAPFLLETNLPRCSPSGTSAPATSSASRPPSARARSACR